MKKLVILGGGFAGVNLARDLGHNPDYSITLIDKNNYNFFPPLIYQVAAGFMSPSDISYPFRKLLNRQPRARFRKGTVIYDENGAIDSIAWDWRRPEINYGYDYRYVWDDLEYRILALQDNGFVEDMEIWRRGKDGERDRLVAQLSYSYDYAGYVSRIEIPNLQATIRFKYHYRDQSNYANSITITEVQRTDTSTYTLRLAPEKLRNTGYVCNVLRAVGAPLTNQYALNPDLYYLGIYGTPVKLLPDAIIERNIYRDGEGDLHSVYSRVGSDYYFYEDNAMLTRSRQP